MDANKKITQLEATENNREREKNRIINKTQEQKYIPRNSILYNLDVMVFISNLYTPSTHERKIQPNKVKC